MHINRVVATPEQAETVLEYFNGFHDGFIKRLALTSYDYFEQRGIQVCSGRLDLGLEIAHYNYRSGEPPADQVVHARFTHVRQLRADIPGNPAEWTLANVHFERGTRPAAVTDEPCFHARFLQNRLVGGEWVLHEALGFSFREADFRESPPA
jgi:hypothetical protein